MEDFLRFSFWSATNSTNFILPSHTDKQIIDDTTFSMEFRITWTYLVPHRTLTNHISAFVKYINQTDDYLHYILHKHRSVFDLSFVVHSNRIDAILNTTHVRYNACYSYHMTDYKHYHQFQEYCTFVAHLLDQVNS